MGSPKCCFDLKSKPIALYLNWGVGALAKRCKCIRQVCGMENEQPKGWGMSGALSSSRRQIKRFGSKRWDYHQEILNQ